MASSTDDLGLPLLSEGKVRRMYRLPDQPGRLLMVATDRISAYDHILSPDIPDKGKVLTGISLWWFDQLRDVVANHLVSTDVPEAVQGRAMVVEELQMYPVECVVRGYLTGSGWAEYQQSGKVCGIALPEGLQDGSRLPEPIFTPATKADYGEHDENIDFDTLVSIVGAPVAEELRRLSLAIYARAEQIARDRGIILADTKVEFGHRADGTIVLGDEVLTPDSSRFWDASQWAPGGSNPSFDKQFVRDWLTFGSGWDRHSDEEPPTLPDNIVSATRDRYLEAWTMLTGVSDPLGSADAGTVRPGTDDQTSAGTDRIGAMARVVVDVMPKPEILDPQGKAITGVLGRRAHEGLTVRQGKRFEITGEGVEDRLDEIREIAETMLANTVIESYDIHVER
ncbi:phosphoribosylaminoimidazolesuccinocarboxamide synthase [Acidipropionibacterium jensenii]|uniref:Phosphoribosylaminoimidazole-succinocarboxamide synthase n=1 Tax=Acidipropionibacterium jensenii TaxID=1749 RepID=A0A3S4VKF1_9ACTN|nr:phosphoribosylaminoimidazolesuccinocarboxamide synthase [Acidipropionibacterium jensenii]AZZ38791.1 phosphoribosylaminoimidazolesuccinocarboxamide synthase [Acidipropionibacterium jensenii]AZZ42847.1 phosphoribosylaminoimidazolesuccinocarboxamide synthase [Acidipropionibacterium jensenii]MDN5977689.1 phosphoribosylaminoimidazolesuccinocarboxamide synthase [Acidipropionibacterium jensenii]MDN5997365.1 phosphoribosylaminoimidazolesuccinocarboxamide synthase [Acidipropionibacterium jensenii]MD